MNYTKKKKKLSLSDKRHQNTRVKIQLYFGRRLCITHNIQKISKKKTKNKPRNKQKKPPKD